MAMKSGVMPGGDAPAFNAVAVVPHNTNNILPCAARALWVGGTGTLTVIMAGDDSNTPVLFSAVPAGVWMPIQVKRVNSTGTTATLIVAVF